MMKKMTVLTCMLIASNCIAQELPDYKQVRAAVTSGKMIRIVADFTKCHAKTNASLQQRINLGVFTPNDIIIDNNDNILSSLTHFSHRDPRFPNKATLQSIQYVITPESNVSLSIQILDPISYQPLTSEVAFNCQLDSAVKIYG